MTIDEFRDALKSEPFDPFVLYTTDGRVLPVPHPGFVLLVTGGQTVVVASASNDDFTIVGLSFLARLDESANGVSSGNPETTH